MPLGTALASGLQAYTAVRDEGRRSRLHDLQVQNYELRNEAQGLNNMFADESYGYRLDQERGLSTQRLADGRRAEADATVAEGTVDSRIGQQEEQWRYERNRANYWGSQATTAASDARVATSTEGSRIDKIHSDADYAFERARSQGADTREKLTGEMHRTLRDLIGDRTLDEAMQDDDVQAHAVVALEAQFDHLLSDGQRVVGIIPVEGGYSVATRMPDGTIAPITENRSSDPDDNPIVFSEDVVAGTLLGPEGAEAMQRTRQDRLVRGTHADQGFAAGQALGEERASAEGRIEGADQRLEEHEQAIPALSQLGSQRRGVAGRIHTLEERRTRGIGSARANAPLDAEIEELEAELAAIDSNLSALQATHGESLGFTPDVHREVVDQAQNRISALDATAERQGQEWAARDAAMQRDIQAGVVERSEALSNLRETGDYRTSRENQQSRRDDQTERFREVADRVERRLKDTPIRGTDGETVPAGLLTGDVMEAIMSSDVMRRMLLEDEARLEAGLTVAATGMARVGKDRGIQTFMLQGEYGGNAELAYDVMESPELADMPDAQRFIVGNLAGGLSRQGMSDTQARIEALRLVQSGQVTNRRALDNWFQRNQRGARPSLSDL